MLFFEIQADKSVDIADPRDIAQHCNSMNQSSDEIHDLFQEITHKVGDIYEVNTITGFMVVSKDVQKLVKEIQRLTVHELRRQELDGTFGFGIEGGYEADFR